MSEDPLHNNAQQLGDAANSPPAEYQSWRRSRWHEIAGPTGKTRMISNGIVRGPGIHTIEGVPGQWSINDAGALTVTASIQHSVRVNGQVVDGTMEVPTESTLEFGRGRTGTVSAMGGAYGVVISDESAHAQSGLTGIDTFPYDPTWVLQGEYRAGPADRRIDVGRLTTPRSIDSIPAPVDLAVTIDGTEYLLAVLADSPTRRLLIFTDETNGAETPEIGRWLLLPLLEAGSSLTVDFNKVTLSYHHIRPSLFHCPLSPPGNHLPMRVAAGETAYAFGRN